MMRFGKESVWCSLSCELCFFYPLFVLFYLLLGLGGEGVGEGDLLCVVGCFAVLCAVCGEVGCCI